MAQDPICGMVVRESTAIKVLDQAQEHFFCSLHCAKKFTALHKLSENQIIASQKKRNLIFQNKTLLVTSILLAAVGLSYFFPILEPFRKSLIIYFEKIWWAILLGFFVGGIIDYFIPREYISVILATSRKRSIVNAVILGFFMSVCSHGILALAIQLHKKGASTPSVVAFLLSSPWANFPLTIMLVGFFGIIRASYIILAAIAIALTTGFIFQFLESKNLIEKNHSSLKVQENFSIAKDFKIRFQQYSWSSAQLKKDFRGILRGTLSLSNMVLWWLLVGMGLAGLAGAYIPEHFFHQYMGPTTAGLLVTLLVATILEVCSEGTAPLAFEIFRQTGALGNSLVFLMAGVATDYTEIGLLWHNVGRRTAIWLPLITVPQVIFFGVVANTIF